MVYGIPKNRWIDTTMASTKSIHDSTNANSFDYDAVYTVPEHNHIRIDRKKWNKEMGQLGNFYREVNKLKKSGIPENFESKFYECAIQVDTKTVAFTDNWNNKWILSMNKDMDWISPRGKNRSQKRVIGIPADSNPNSRYSNDPPTLWNM